MKPPLQLPLSSHTIGPFFPPHFFSEADNDLTRVSRDAAPTRSGTPYILRGTVMKEGRIPVPNAILEFWQADSSGRFRHPLDPAHAEADPDFLGWGRDWTDLEGCYSFRSVLPKGYAEIGTVRAPHANLRVMGAGLMNPVCTTVFFPDFALENAKDPVLNAVPPELRQRLVVAERAPENGVRVFSFDILLRGSAEDETPFFQD
ncbi:protocatechuate 3,4-dioxygenase [Rhabdaerophilum sp. SD176]|uniref:protocatechuate 3,4-dioxygenase n=1 Tax=Rhabdaerophilum sp. SD176 TaxID=2983548 RepID=UPI0024DF5603|nr:protocatechuate 3,4-dioxygenase [Rhabdaerophilum sp. SD176]